ncbi:response regulator [Marinovum sp. 2_MG-2023]|uniref:response regulator n=1 Tax=Roseobacteraceae TaxID=2854170 RepID=UPI001FD4E237|nr:MULTISPECIES: response regulator [Roseobacteraceae]MCJ7875013.1 response regulator [Phaeobacter sp. J2-8]MDO6730567.1 response regulator [Marinovum sp. 2_MG-2023]MDO6778717.1 response regulator [Marinovum sp. 1_MG-2023]
MDDLENLQIDRTPSPERPLLGLTVLVVEDSRFACEAMRLLCLRSGARIRRADCLRSARRHLRVYRPSVTIVDLGLPDGSGAELIAELAAGSPRIPVILGTSGDDFAEDMAVAAGADGFMLKPIVSLINFQELILSLLPPERQPTGPRPLTEVELHPDQIAFQDDMAHIAGILCDGTDDKTMDYVGQFLSGVARIAHDDALSDAAEKLILMRREGQPVGSQTARIAGLIQERLTHRIAI